MLVFGFRMMHIVLPILLFCSWFAILLVPAGKLAIEDLKAGVPEDKRHGVSVMPVFPVMPLLFWGLAYGIDRFCGPWGSVSIMVLHSIALLWAIFAMVRDHRILKRMDSKQPPAGGRQNPPPEE